MNRVFKVIINEGIIQVVIVIFAFIGILISLFVLSASFQMRDDEFIKMLSSRGFFTWFFVLVPAVVVSLLFGACMTLWKMKWPTREEDTSY